MLYEYVVLSGRWYETVQSADILYDSVLSSYLMNRATSTINVVQPYQRVVHICLDLCVSQLCYTNVTCAINASVLLAINDAHCLLGHYSLLQSQSSLSLSLSLSLLIDGGVSNLSFTLVL